MGNFDTLYFRKYNSQLVFCAPERAKTHVRQSWHTNFFSGSRFALAMYLWRLRRERSHTSSRRKRPLVTTEVDFQCERSSSNVVQVVLVRSNTDCPHLRLQLVYIQTTLRHPTGIDFRTTFICAVLISDRRYHQKAWSLGPLLRRRHANLSLLCSWSNDESRHFIHSMHCRTWSLDGSQQTET